MPAVSEKVLKKYKVSPQNRRRIRDVAAVNLSFLTDTFNDNLIRGGRPYSVEQVYPIVNRFGKADFEIASRLEEEFRRFVALTLIRTGVPHAPPGAVDMYWHFFILHSKEYFEFCNNVWGSFEGSPGFRHHYPSTDETRPGQFRAYAATRELYVEVFGEPKPYERVGASPVDIWTPVRVDASGVGQGSDTSGDSYSGIVDPRTFSYDG